MEEIAASFDAANLPSGFLANAEIYRRLAGFKDCPQLPSLDDVAHALMRAEPALVPGAGTAPPTHNAPTDHTV
jgi:hypothetical protein